MAQGGGQPSLAAEAFGEGRVMHKLRQDDLDGDGPVELRVNAFPDFDHAPRPDQALHDIFA